MINHCQSNTVDQPVSSFQNVTHGKAQSSSEKSLFWIGTFWVFGKSEAIPTLRTLGRKTALPKPECHAHGLLRLQRHNPSRFRSQGRYAPLFGRDLRQSFQRP